MRNRTRYILALSAFCAICYAFGSVSWFDGSSCAASSVAARQDDDPFADDDGSNDPFADSSDDEGIGSSDSSDPFADSSDDSSDDSSGDFSDDFSEDEEANSSDANDPFEDKGRVDPFAPSSLSGSSSSRSETTLDSGSKKVDSKKAESEEELDPEAKERAKERAKYLRPEDVPDELKTDEDFYATASPAEKAVLANEPKTVAEWFSAAVRVARVGRPSFARVLIAKALEAPEGSPEECAKALDSLGAGRAVYFVANPEIGEIGSEVYQKVCESARRYWESEATLRDAIARTERGSVSDRAQAIVDVRKGGAVAIATLIVDLIGDDSAKSATAATLIPFFESDGEEALLAALREVDEEKLPAVVGVLEKSLESRVGFELALRYCMGVKDESARTALVEALVKRFKSAPTQEEYARLCFQKALELFKRTVLPTEVDGQVARWRWDSNGAKPYCEEVESERARLDETARLALASRALGLASGVTPSNATELAVVAFGERELYRVGADSASEVLDDFDVAFPELSVAELCSSIKFALESKRFDGALIPTILLRSRGDESLCYSRDGEPTVVVQAAICADRRVRYEALSAIMQWNPRKSYPMSSRTLEALEWFASSKGERVVVVASPKLDDANRIGLNLTKQGYKFVSVATGREALLAAQSCADVEFVLATEPVSSPDLRVVAQMLRSDLRTCDVPLLVGYDDERQATSANVKVGTEPNVFIAPTPFNLESSSWAIQRLFDKTKARPVASEARLAQAKSAARAILATSLTRPNLYEFDNMNDMARRFLASPSMFDVGLEYASVIKTSFAQNALIDLMGDVRFDVSTRRRALEAFKKQLGANGSLLRGPDVSKMYDRYNASETEDVETQKVLSEALDAYEQATK